MIGTQGTYYKALLLLLVFSLNTVVSFACSFGGLFHHFHHHGNSAAIESGNADRNHHSHDKPATHAHKHDHEKSSTHKHGSESPDQTEGNCCSNSVVELQKTEKAVSRSIEVPNFVFIISFLASYSDLFLIQPGQKTVFQENIRWRPPTTIQDLRIVIQSFQI